MLSRSDFQIAEAERLLGPLGISAAYLAPTSTALEKSIIDAIEPVRSLLRREGLHDFSLQGQGTDERVSLPIRLFAGGADFRSSMSLYRPVTKAGDPRLWISDLRKRIRPRNLLALAVIDGTLVAICLSHAATREQMLDQTSELGAMLTGAGKSSEAAVQQVLAELKAVASTGWVRTTHHGDTAVGMTLERCLGVAPNSTPSPDFLGFELKAKVLKPNETDPEDSATRQTLFACVPDWQLSQIKSSEALLDAHGYPDKKAIAERRLNCTVSALKPNRQGLVFSIDHGHGHLVEYCEREGSRREVVRWRGERLEQRLATKHAKTAWVYARETTLGGHRHFRFTKAMISSGPRAGAFLNLIEGGAISMDHLSKRMHDGTMKERGPLFKMKASDFGLLFPVRRKFLLSTEG
jgi:hypothetical protein